MADNPLDEAGSFSSTSDVLPPAEFPQFSSHASATYQGGSGGAFAPVEGDWYVGSLHTDDTYTRVGSHDRSDAVRPLDKSRASTSRCRSTPNRGYDNVIVEAHTVG